MNNEERNELVNELVQVSGTLDKIQFEGVDAIITAELTSGKAAARNRRKGLNVRCESLRTMALALHSEFMSK